MAKSALIGVTLAWCLVSLVSQVSGDSTPDNYELPSNHTVVNGGPIVTGFSCEGLQYGYYADVNNGCRVFHICYPYMDAYGQIRTRMWSFICGLGSIFNQQALVCDHPQNSIPCDQSPTFYNINDYFGREDQNFRE